MQLRLPWQVSREASPRALVIGGRPYEIHIVRHRLARRYLLRVRRDGELQLTVPRGAAIGAGLRFVEGQAPWIERERTRLEQRAARAPIDEGLRAQAMKLLPARCIELAAVHGVPIARVSVRNQRSRWGSCSPKGVISLNWRLIQMPASVCDYVILHELMHVRQANHSRRFWREVEGVCPAWRDAERWLRKNGKELL